MTVRAGVELDLWRTIATSASEESRLWVESLLPVDRRVHEPVFSELCSPAHALGVETIYEGYLVHYGRSRLFGPADDDAALLLGDYLYAHGLVRIAALGDVAAVGDLAELISLCMQVRADGRDGDGAAWAATSCLLGSDAGTLGEARDALRLDDDPEPLARAAREVAGEDAYLVALGAHARLVG